MMIDLNKEREEFEAWYSKMWIGSFDKSKCGEFYKSAKVNMCWLSWLESAKVKQAEIDELKKHQIEQGQRFNEQSQVIADLKHKLAKVESGEWVLVPKEEINALRDKAMDAKYFSENESKEYARTQFEEIQLSLEAMIKAAQENEDE